MAIVYNIITSLNTLWTLVCHSLNPTRVYSKCAEPCFSSGIKLGAGKLGSSLSPRESIYSDDIPSWLRLREWMSDVPQTDSLGPSNKTFLPASGLIQDNAKFMVHGLHPYPYISGILDNVINFVLFHMLCLYCHRLVDVCYFGIKFAECILLFCVHL